MVECKWFFVGMVSCMIATPPCCCEKNSLDGRNLTTTAETDSQCRSSYAI